MLGNIAVLKFFKNFLQLCNNFVNRTSIWFKHIHGYKNQDENVIDPKNGKSLSEAVAYWLLEPQHLFQIERICMFIRKLSVLELNNLKETLILVLKE